MFSPIINMNSSKTVWFVLVLVTLWMLVAVRARGWVRGVYHHATFSASQHHRNMKDEKLQRRNFAHLRVMFRDLIRAMPRADIMWPEYGTLLGIARRRQPIAYDDDLDFGAQNTDYTAIVNALRTNLDPATYHVSILVVKFPLRIVYVQVWHKQFNIHADIAFYAREFSKVDVDDRFRRLVPRCITNFPAEWYLPLQPVTCSDGTTCVVPHRTDQILHALYGENWTVANKPEYL